MAKPPHTRAEMRAFYPICQVAELAAGYRDTTHEGELLQFIPGCGQDVPGERSPWRGTLLNDATIGLLDPYAAWREVPDSHLATERRDRDNRPVSLDTQCHVAQTVRKPLEPPQPAANGHLELEGFNLPPARQAAVRVKGAG